MGCKPIRSLLVTRLLQIGFNEDPVELVFTRRAYSDHKFIGVSKTLSRSLVRVGQSSSDPVAGVFRITPKVKSPAVSESKIFQFSKKLLFVVGSNERYVLRGRVTLILGEIETPLEDIIDQSYARAIFDPLIDPKVCPPHIFCKAVSPA